MDFPLSINMLPYTTKPNSRKVDKSRYLYDLASAVVHKGKLEAGHYYVYCRQGDQVSQFHDQSSSSSSYRHTSSLTLLLTCLCYQWMLFNDDQVTAVSEAEVLNADAYLLFYTLRSLSTRYKRDT